MLFYKKLVCFEHSIKKFEYTKNFMTDSKKDLILKTARELIAKNGFAKTTLDDIANVMGMKKSSIYYYYTNKDALLQDVMKKEEEYFCSMVLHVFNSSGKTIDKIIEYEKLKFKYIHETIKFHQVSTNIILEFKNKFFEHIKRIQTKETEMLKNILDESIMNNEIRNCDTKSVAELILTLSEALRHRELYFASLKFDKSVNFKKAINEMIFAINLIFGGLSIK